MLWCNRQDLLLCSCLPWSVECGEPNITYKEYQVVPIANYSYQEVECKDELHSEKEVDPYQYGERAQEYGCSGSDLGEILLCGHGVNGESECDSSGHQKGHE